MSDEQELQETESTVAQPEAPAQAPATPQVSRRDFSRPKRLSAARLEELSEALVRCLPDIVAHLADTLGTTATLELEGLAEKSADGLFDDCEPPLAMLRFLVAGQPGWIVWDNQSALATIESLLGSPSANPTNRALSQIERRVLGGLLADVATLLAGSLSLSAEEFAVVREPEEIGSWREVEGVPDPYRLGVELRVGGPQPSSIQLYLPGFKSASPSAAAGAGLGRLPEHLDRVEVELRAHLDGCTIPLDQLLSLEEGDVIPIDAGVGDPVIASVEGSDVALARWGTHRGHMAIRIERFLEEVDR